MSLLDACEAAHARGARVAAYGCLIARHEAELRQAIPEIDLFSPFDTGPCSTCWRASGRAPAGALRAPAGARPTPT